MVLLEEVLTHDGASSTSTWAENYSVAFASSQAHRAMRSYCGDLSTSDNFLSVVFPSTHIQEAWDSVGHWPCRPEGNAEGITVERKGFPLR